MILLKYLIFNVINDTVKIFNLNSMKLFRDDFERLLEIQNITYLNKESMGYLIASPILNSLNY